MINIIVKSESGPHNNPPKILLVSPPHITSLSYFKDEFVPDGKLKSFKLRHHYQEIAEEFGTAFFDAAEIVKASDLDGIHLDIDEHVKLGLEIDKIVKEILK